MWENIKASFGHSFTILAARFFVIFGAVAQALPDIAVGIVDQSVAIQKLLPSPEAGKWIMALGIVVEIARWRTAGK